jgi:predicted ATP-binding protein involved in virulence
MRVSRISVKQLFNTFDHSIPLDLVGRITIIHGLNGLGKTTVLRMVKNLCSGRYAELNAVPFKKLKLDFDNGASISVTKSPEESEAKENKKRHPLTIRHYASGGSKESYKPPIGGESHVMPEAIEWLDRRVPGLDRVGPGRWRYTPTREVLSTDEVLERFGEYLPPGLSLIPTDAPEWLQTLNKEISVRLIETQRLVAARVYRPHQDYDEGGIGPAIVMHSGDLASRIARQESEYGALSQSLDRSFPMRYVQQKTRISMSEDELRTRFQNLESKRAKLEEAGLLEKEKTGFELPAEMDEATKGVMSIYVRDIEEKLGVFDNLAARIDLFRDILNEHFMYKELRVSKRKGFRFFSTRTSEELDATDLSSGEQHEVVVLYELLFHVQGNSLVMIDEPEISLHIAWQEEFLRDLQQIIKLSPFDAVIATHSPQIVNDRWNLTVELTGPEEQKK